VRSRGSKGTNGALSVDHRRRSLRKTGRAAGLLVETVVRKTVSALAIPLVIVAGLLVGYLLLRPDAWPVRRRSGPLNSAR
jgi:hypothetical protein